MNRSFVFLLLLLIITSCNSPQISQDTIVAKVNDQTLFLSQVEEVVPNNSTKEDSIIISDSYINQWVKKQLMISKAELNLSAKEKDVSNMVEDYRSSLIIHKYLQLMVKQKLDTTITTEEIQKYYDQYKSNFTLNKNIIKALYIKIKKPVPNLKDVKKLYRSKKQGDMDRLEDYCFQNATKFDNFNLQWIYSQNLLNKIPIQIDKEELFLSKNKYFEAQDSIYHYFVNIQDFQLKNTLAPLIFVREDIRLIIRNKRKLQFIKNLEDNIFRDAQAKNEYKIY